jgi:hypothetical protein
MIRVWAVAVASVLLLGCQEAEEPPRGSRVGFGPAVVSTESAPMEPPQPVPRFPPDPPVHEVAAVEATEKEEERDLGAELRAALGTPSDCVSDFIASKATTIRVNVSGIVRPTGMIIEPAAYGAGLSSTALDCIRQRVGTVVLDPLDDTVSSTASTVIEIAYEPPVIIESDPGVPEPKLKNVKHPLPKRPDIPPSGKPIQGGTDRPIEGGTASDPNGPQGVPITGPKPRAIDGYEVDENAQEWR